MVVGPGKKAIVTGSASGIGRAIALALARRGVDVCLIDIDSAPLEQTTRDCADFGVEVFPRVCDLADPIQLDHSVRAILSRWRDIDILVNNAGIAYYGPTHSMPAGEFDRILAVNLIAPVALTSRLLPTLLSREASSVLNVCSLLGLVPARRLAAYQTSKAGLIGFTESLSAEYGRQGLCASALCPGFVKTNLLERAGSHSRRKPFPLPPFFMFTTPERVAAAAIHALQGRHGVVPVTWPVRAALLLKRAFPRLTGYLVREGWRRSRRKSEQFEAAPSHLES